MANLAIIGSSHVNGVAGIHTEILRSRVFLPFAQLFPDKFLNITNGVTQVRFLACVLHLHQQLTSCPCSAAGWSKQTRNWRLLSPMLAPHNLPFTPSNP
jgi:glycogen phosphorylase